ncbi:putative vacuolar membrane transporter for cationic amino acids [Coemansia sp. Benny D115]|nr:putative vacuolar membrane transporter for cationic amino acids [Coemansia sp. Benny D115]
MFIYHKSDDDVFGASQLPEGAERPPLLVRRGRRAVKLSDPGYTQRRLQEYLEAEREALIERGIIPEIHVSGENSRLQQRRVSSYGAVDPIHGQHGSGKQGSTGGFKSAVLRLCDYVSRRLTSLREMGSGKTGRAIAIATLVLVVLIAIGVGSRVFLSYYPQHITDVVSQVFGYISAAMFFIAYIPQIAWNFTAQSTEGLSASMFVFTVLGNVTYCLSILAMSTEKDYLIAYAPWLAGALGTLGFEMLVLWQCYFYSRPQSTDSQSGSTSGNNTEVAESEDRDGGSTSENENDVGSLLSRRAHRRSRRRRYSGVTGKSLSRSRTRYSPGSSQHHLALSSSIEEEEASLG